MNLKEELDSHTMEGALYAKLPGGKVLCRACARRCVITAGSRGACKIRFNDSGVLKVPYGYVAGLARDPIEKKPFFHVLPGSEALSFGMLGCNFSCSFCQNYITSQALRDPLCGSEIREISAQELVDLAERWKTPVITSTYNEPLITSEWAAAVFEKAAGKGILCGYVSNGYATDEVLEYLRPFTALYKVDLKTFSETGYRKLGGVKLKPVLDAIAKIKEMGFWLEIVTLVIPGFNDSEAELRAMAGFIASVSKDIPWHVSAFHADYKMTATFSTPRSALVKAAGIGKAQGLKFVYVGNIAGGAEGLENTYCPDCSLLLVERAGFSVSAGRILPHSEKAGKCPRCSALIPGIFTLNPLQRGI